MLMKSDTKVVVNYDCDILLPRSSYKHAYDIINNEVNEKIEVESYILVSSAELQQILKQPHHFCDTFVVENDEWPCCHRVASYCRIL